MKKNPMKLEAGTTEAIYDNQINNPLYKSPTFQILKFEGPDGSGSSARIRANLSDGTYYIKAYFSSAYNQHFESGALKSLSLIKISNFLVKVKNNIPFIYVQKLEEFQDCTHKIGNAISISLRSTVNTSNSFKDSFDENSYQKKENISEKEIIAKEDSPKLDMPKYDAVKNTNTKKENVPLKQEITKDEDTKKVKLADDTEHKNTNTTKLVTLNPFLNEWSIEGRVISKSEIKTFSTQKGEGKLFSFEFQDSTSQIKVISFNESVDIFYPLVEIGDSYRITKGTVKMANKQFSSNNCDYEIHLEKNSEIKKIESKEKYTPNFKFMNIKDINSKGIIDVIGIIKDVYPSSSIVVRSRNKETLKRDLVLVDETASIKLTLWGEKCDLPLEAEQVLMLKGVKVNEYNGYNLSSMQSTQLFINLENERSFELKGWYEQNKGNIKTTFAKKVEKRQCIQEIKDDELEYSYIVGSIMFLKEDNLSYDSCLSENCNKKVILEDNGLYRCDKCNCSFEDCNQRYIITANLCDYTGQMWVNIFNDPAVSLFNYTAKELKELRHEDSSQVQSIIKNSYYKEFGFKIKSRHEYYNNEPRTKYSVLSVDKINYLDECKSILSEIERRLS